ncbi:MAG: O-acetyl-ADP-ribose deacetylase (regulator of RNase III) [Polyangiales bacterium]|jgi:O-acetyl-ADP-ribose deacetylase (regulator of RNase III)
MEVTLLNRSAYTIPSKKRVDAIVFDGARDMQIWPGPGLEAKIREHYGDDLQRALDAELKQVPGRMLDIPSVIRVHQGRLHCNFLLWAATREPEPGSTRSPAPGLKMIDRIVTMSLDFALERHVKRIAFPALGGGPGEASVEDRLVTIVKAAQAYYDKAYEEGRALGIEEVIVCVPSAPVFRNVHSRVRNMVKVGALPAPPPSEKKPVRRRAAGGASKAKTTKAKKPTGLSMAEANENSGAAKYNMRATYAENDFFTHPKFGVGKVIGLPAQGQMECSFEDGSVRKLVHSR